MKNFNFKVHAMHKLLTLLCLLIVGMGQAWAYTATFRCVPALAFGANWSEGNICKVKYDQYASGTGADMDYITLTLEWTGYMYESSGNLYKIYECKYTSMPEDGAKWLHYERWEGSTWKENTSTYNDWKNASWWSGCLHTNTWTSYSYKTWGFDDETTVVWDAGNQDWGNTTQLYVYKKDDANNNNDYVYTPTMNQVGSTQQFYHTFDGDWSGYGGFLFRGANDWSHGQTTNINTDASSSTGIIMFTHCGDGSGYGSYTGGKSDWQKISPAYKASKDVTVYFDNTVTNWSEVHLKYGSQYFNKNIEITSNVVPGTNGKLLYYTFPHDIYYGQYMFADGQGYTNYWPLDDENCSHYTALQASHISSATTLIPTANAQKGATTVLSGYERTVTISSYSHGTVHVTYTDASNTARDRTSAGDYSVQQACVITVTAEADEHYELTGLTVGGVAFTSGNTYAVRANTTITATFSEITHNVTATARPAAGGTVTPNSASAYGEVTGGSITATDNTGYDFSKWIVTSGNGTITSATTASTTFKPTEASTVTALFCPESASGIPVYKFIPATSDLGTSKICSNTDDVPLTVANSKLSALVGGTLTAKSSGASGSDNLKYNNNSFNFNSGDAAWLIIGLDCSIQAGDVIRYRYTSASSNNTQLSIQTSKGTTTNQINLPGSNTTNGTIQTVTITSTQATAFASLNTIYLVRTGSNTSYLDYFEILRPYKVLLNASTNGGKVNGSNKDSLFFAQGESKVLPHATKTDYMHTGWFAASSGGSAVDNPYEPTGSTTLYAQFASCPSSGTVYKFQVKTGLTNGTKTAGDLNVGNFLSTLDGGTAVMTGTHAQIVNTNAIDFADNSGDYITVDLDCALQTGDTIITTISGTKSGIKITSTGSTTSLQNVSYGTNVKTIVPSGLNNYKTFRLYRQDSNAGGISYFEIKRPAHYTITHDLTNVTKSSGATEVIHKAGYTATYAAADGYELPATISVTRGVTDITNNCTWSAGTVTIPAADCIGDITISVTGEEPSCSAPTSPSISGTTSYSAGNNISLTASATGTDGSTTYQWYKGDPENGGVSQGDASTSGATLTINSCVTGDAGTYYCVISNGDGCTVTTYQAITVSCLTAPSAVASLSNSTHTTTSLTYTWTKASNASGYTATLYSDADCTVSVEAKALGDVATATFTGLTPNTTYYCKVQSKGNGTVYCEDGGTTSKVSGATDAPSAPTFSPTSGTTVSGSQSITITGHSGSTVYYAWATSSQSASDIYNSGSGSHGTADAGTASTTVQSGKTLYAISRLSSVNSAVSSASYTVDATAPTFVSSVPANSATGVNISGTIVLTFSEALGSVDGSKFTLTNATKGAVAIDGSDNTKVNIAYSGASYSTTVTLATAAGAVADAVGNTSAALSSISFTTKAEPTLTAISANTLYQAADMATETLTGSEAYWDGGFSSDNYFKTYGSKASSNTAKGQTITSTEVEGQNFTSKAYIEAADNTSSDSDPTHGAIEFKTPSKAGKLLVYTVDGSSSKLSIKKKGASTSTTTDATCKVLDVDANTNYFINGAGSKRGIYGIYYDKLPEFSSSSPANGDTDVPVSGTIVLTFDESIADVDDEKFTLSSGSISAVAVDGSDDTKVNITYSGLPGSTEVTLSVAAGAVTDAAGNTSAALSDIIFTTESTCTDPSLAFGSSSVTMTLCDETYKNTFTNNYGVTVTYESSDTDKAEVASDGTVTLKAAGEVTITASSEEQTISSTTYCEDEVSYTLTISSSTAAGLAYGTSTIKKDVGDDNFTNTLTNNNNLDVTYTSSDEDVATVDSDGEVTIKAAGTTTITASSAQQEVSSTCYAAGSATYSLTVYNVYTVTYDATDGTCGTVSAKTETGEVTLPTPTHASYSFDGWYTTAGVKAGDAGDAYEPTGDVTLYAKWSGSCAGGGSTTLISITPTITNDNKNNSSASASGTPGGTAYWDKMGTSSPYKLNSDGAYFALKLSSGYYQATDVLVINGADGAHLVYYGSHGSGTYLGTTGSPSSGTINFTLTGLPSSVDEIYVYRTNDTYNKKLSSISVTRSGGTCYTVTYHGNGSTSGYTNDPAQHTAGSDVTVKYNDPTTGFKRTGYEFNGWNTEDDGSGTHYDYWDIDHNEIENIAADVDLYAEWRIVINADNTDFAGKDAPTAYKDVKVTNGATLTITNATTVRDITVTDGATLKLQKGTTAHDVTVETGSTLNIAKDGESGVTLATNSLSLVGGWGTVGDETKYDMPRVYIDPKSTLTKSEDIVNFDIAVDNRNYYPIAVPFPVDVADVDYASAYLASYSRYGLSGQYAIKKYNGQQRANRGSNHYNWEVMDDGVEYGSTTETLLPGQGYILTALPAPGYGDYAVIRFPMNVDNAWTAGGEKGSATISAETVTKNKMDVTAYVKAEGETANSNKGWNLLGIPYMSCFATSADMHSEHTEDVEGFIKGRFNYTTYAWEDGDIMYVTVPTHDFSEYKQYDINDEETKLLPGWCFFIQADKDGTLTFEAEEQTNNGLIYAPKREQEHKPTVKTGIILSGAGAKDKTTILVSDKYSAADYEINADLEKMFGENSFTLATYSLSGATRLAYNAMSNADARNIIPIGYRAPAEGEYTFSINPRYAENFEQVNLIDYQTNTITNLLTSSYTFTTERTQNDARFALNVVPRQETPTDVENGESIQDENGIRKVLINNQIYIIRGQEVFDATGKRVQLK